MRFLLVCRHLILLAAVCFHREAIAESAFPVVCTKAVPFADRINLEHLKDMPVPEIASQGGLTFVNPPAPELTVLTWRQFEWAHAKKYAEKTNFDIAMSGWFWRMRGHIPFLEQARPATRSFVRQLKPGKSMVRWLPLSIAPLLGEESNAVGVALQNHQTWLQFYPGTRISKRSATEMSLRMGRYEMTITLLAFGDFNHDGLDDLLVCYSQGVTDGTFAYSGLVVLTRNSKTESLRVIKDFGTQ